MYLDGYLVLIDYPPLPISRSAPEKIYLENKSERQRFLTVLKLRSLSEMVSVCDCIVKKCNILAQTYRNTIFNLASIYFTDYYQLHTCFVFTHACEYHVTSVLLPAGPNEHGNPDDMTNTNKFAEVFCKWTHWFVCFRYICMMNCGYTCIHNDILNLALYE